MTNVGPLQGEVISLVLFSLYVNVFEVDFLKNDTLPLNLRDFHLFVLMYADDKFAYLGVLLNFNDEYHCTQKQLPCQAGKAMVALKSNVKTM